MRRLPKILSHLGFIAAVFACGMSVLWAMDRYKPQFESWKRLRTYYFRCSPQNTGACREAARMELEKGETEKARRLFVQSCALDDRKACYMASKIETSEASREQLLSSACHDGYGAVLEACAELALVRARAQDVTKAKELYQLACSNAAREMADVKSTCASIEAALHVRAQ